MLNGAAGRLMPGQAVALVGPSGAGKSTLLHIAGLLEAPDERQASSSTAATARGMDDDDRTRVRRAEMGFVYQFHQLLPEFSALENVAHAADDPGPPRSDAEARAREIC